MIDKFSWRKDHSKDVRIIAFDNGHGDGSDLPTESKKMDQN